MHGFYILGLFSALVAASPTLPVPSGGDTLADLPPPKTLLSNATLDACAAATNCETYDDPLFGTRIRFVPGMEPGSEHFKREVENAAVDKRNQIETHVTMSDTSISYGHKGPAGPNGVIHNLYAICHEGSCETNPFTVWSHFASQTDEADLPLILHAHGQYNGWDMRNIFVEALVAASGEGKTCGDVNWSHGNPGGAGATSGSVYECRQTNYIGFNRFVGGSLQGFMEVQVERPEQGGGWCDALSGALGGISGVIGVLPGFAVFGGASAFFGSLSAFCH